MTAALRSLNWPLFCRPSKGFFKKKFLIDQISPLWPPNFNLIEFRKHNRPSCVEWDLFEHPTTNLRCSRPRNDVFWGLGFWLKMSWSRRRKLQSLWKGSHSTQNDLKPPETLFMMSLEACGGPGVIPTWAPIQALDLPTGWLSRCITPHRCNLWSSKVSQTRCH